MRRLVLALALFATTAVAPIVAAPAGAATCSIDATLTVERQGMGYFVSGRSVAVCTAPAPASNLVTVQVAPANLLLRLLLVDSSRTITASCSNGDCTTTTAFINYAVGPNIFLSLLNRDAPFCFTATTSATNGGTRTLTACG